MNTRNSSTRSLAKAKTRPRSDKPAGPKGTTTPFTVESEKLAGIEYIGVARISRECLDAVLRLIQYGTEISLARILSFDSRHCLLLTVNSGDTVAIKSGFTSGYGGEGPRTFSYLLQLLRAHGVEIDEYVVAKELIERLDRSSLTQNDLDAISEAKPVSPRIWYDYILEADIDTERQGGLWRELPFVIPFAIVETRLIDLAISFWQSPDERLLTGYRRLEDIVRKRTGIDEHGAKLFGRVFAPKGGKLTWLDIDESERVGRMNLFTSIYMTYRNPRAHRESTREQRENSLMEFLLLNQLYLLENESTEVATA